MNNAHVVANCGSYLFIIIFKIRYSLLEKYRKRRYKENTYASGGHHYKARASSKQKVVLSV